MTYKETVTAYMDKLREEMRKPHRLRDTTTVSRMYQAVVAAKNAMENEILETEMLVGDKPEPLPETPKIMKNAKPEKQHIPTTEIDGGAPEPRKTRKPRKSKKG